MVGLYFSTDQMRCATEGDFVNYIAQFRVICSPKCCDGFEMEEVNVKREK